MSLTLTPPEKPMSAILRLILMNPRWTFGITVGLAGISASLAAVAALNAAQIDSLEAQLTAANTTISVQTEAAKGIAALADARADVAAQAVRAAAEAGRADRRAAEVYLNLPTPAPADRCEAARELIDDAIREEN